MGRTKSMKHLRDAVMYSIYFLSLFFPRSKNTWVFIGWHRGHEIEIFADNTKYLFLHVANTHKDIHAVWLAKDQKLAALLRSRGYNSYYQHSLLGIWYALRAGTTVIDAFLQPENFCFTGRTSLVQLLHGKGMKKGGYTQKPLRTQDYIFSTSPYVSKMLPPIFVQQSPIIEIGYPRSDVLFRTIAGSDIGVDASTQSALSDPQYTKRFLYAPTFRRGQKTLDIEKTLDLPRLSGWLVEHSYLLAISLHPKYRDQSRDLSYPNIHFVEDSDIYPLFPLIDVLITDFSNTFTDFLLLDKPIIFYPYDIETYKEKEGLTYDNYDDYTPGPKAYTPQKLLKTLEDVLSRDTYDTERQRVCNLYHTYQDGESSERITHTLLISTCEDIKILFFTK